MPQNIEKSGPIRGASWKSWWIYPPLSVKTPFTVEKSPNNASPNQPKPARFSDEYWMRKALHLAKKAGARDEVPVGAVLVKDNQILALGSNRREQWQSPLGHAELIAVERASKKLGSWRVLDSTLYVTLEPCLMCAGVLQQARIKRVVFGAFDQKAGALISLYTVGSDPRLNHQIEVTAGTLEHECAEVLTNFFRQKRKNKTRT